MTQRTAEREDQFDEVHASEPPGRKSPPDSGRPRHRRDEAPPTEVPRTIPLISNFLPRRKQYVPALQRLVTPLDEDMPGKVCVRAGWCRPQP